MKNPSLLVAVGCSWVAAKSIDTEPTALTFNWDHVEDPAFVEKHSFSGLLKQKLGLDQIHFIAASGDSNQGQARKLIDFLEHNKEQYSKIFVLWGITSIYRWEMYSNTTNQLEPCILRSKRSKNKGLIEESEYYFKHFWNKENSLRDLGRQILLVDAYLTMHSIDHLFFNSFDPYTLDNLNITSITDSTFYKIKESHNDMLSLLCAKHDVTIGSSSVPWLNVLKKTPAEQFHNNTVKNLQAKGLLDCSTAHPTVRAHADIASGLHDYIKGHNNERI